MLLKKELSKYNRYQAFVAHIAISSIIFFILLAFITLSWYPGILFDTGNGWKAIGMIVGIDMILGPLLTLIVFNPKKSSLKFDLSIIAFIQIAALAYGSWTIHQTRPIAIAYVNNHFLTFFANSEMSSDMQQRIQELKTQQLFYVFNDALNDNNLAPTQFEPYAKHAATVRDAISPYKSGSLIRIDPLMSSSRFIQINEKTGAIQSFVNIDSPE